MSQPYLSVPYPNTYWVIYGQLLAGEHPTELDDDATTARLASLMDAGIRTFVDLTEMREMTRSAVNRSIAGSNAIVLGALLVIGHR